MALKSLPHNRARRRGATLVEMLAAAIIMATVAAGTCALYAVGERTAISTRNYMNNQTNGREALRRIERTIRHGSAVLMGQTTISNFTGATDSTSSQIIVNVPQADSTTLWDQVRIYVDASGNIYGQKESDTGEGTLLMTGPATLTFAYNETTNTTTGSALTLNCTPASATEVEITLTSTYFNTTTTTHGYVELRNQNLGL